MRNDTRGHPPNSGRDRSSAHVRASLSGVRVGVCVCVSQSVCGVKSPVKCCNRRVFRRRCLPAECSYINESCWCARLPISLTDTHMSESEVCVFTCTNKSGS